MEHELITSKADLVFEISWEICNKVGGIYTVVKSKVEPIKKYYGDNYFMIGPYFHEKAIREFEETVPPDDLKKIFEELSEEGINCHFGEWLTKGHPKIILLEFNDFATHKDGIKKDLWDQFKVDSLGTEYFDFDEPVVWAWAVGKLLEKIKQTNENKKVVAHCHEWLAGGALLYVKRQGINIATIFTTHATMLGRTMASNNVDLYSNIESINPEEEARALGIISKFSMEKSCANNATIFTTVSEITGIEAGSFFGRNPDVLLLNGLDMEKFPSFEDVSIKHKNLKNDLKEFCMHYFFPYQTFNIDDTLFFFTAARYEFHDKGLDMMTESLGKLNEYLKEKHPEKTIVVFYWVPTSVRNIKNRVIENKTNYHDIHESLKEESEDIMMKMIALSLKDENFSKTDIFSKDLIDNIKKKLLRFRKEGDPPLCTHDLFYEENDPLIRAFHENGLLNRKEDRVKAIFYPIYLTGADGLLDTDYYESMMSCNLGIFPSYYEPWGYTPLEAGAIGIASITTDLAGFGRYIKVKQFKEDPNKGIFVVERANKTYEEAREEMFEIFKKYVTMNKYDRIQNKINANKLTHFCDWKNFVKNYIQAHNLALEKIENNQQD